MIRVPSFFLFLAVFLTGTVSLHAAGAVTGKQYAAGTGQTFSYFAGRLPHEVSVARSTGGSLTYGYSTDGAKDLTSAAWPEVVSGVFTIPPATQGYGYDRAGRLRTIGDSSGNRTQAYQNGRLKATTWNSGRFAGNQLITDLDTSGRDCGFTLNRNGTTIHSATRVPNGVSGEISEVSSGGLTIVIKRNAARQITGFEWHPTDPTAPVVTQTWSRSAAGRILTAGSSVVGSPSFDWINSQTKTLRISAASGARVWAGLAGGDLTEIPDFNLTGSSNLTLPSTQSSGWVPWHTLAMLPGEGEGTFGANAVYNPLASPDAKAEQFGAVWIPPVNETFAYDADGNRQSTALWDYGWDGRNKLVRARTKDYNISTTPQGYDVTCDYDAENRRCKKFVTTYQNGSIVSQDHITFLWDGWDMIYERHQQPSGLTTLERKYVWGPDLSGSHGGAGGAGGLLLIRETRGTQTKDYYPLYDGCGHVIALADSNGNLVAEYAYGPFGELIHAKGPMAQINPIRYATKYYDSELGLYYFGQRYLDPITNQWLSREPLGEGVSVNLYSYCHSDPINKVDMQGLEEVVVGPVLRKGIPTMIYQDWEGTGLEYLWNAVGWGNVTQPERRPTAEQLAINFYQEDGVWHVASEGARHNAGMAAAMPAVSREMNGIKDFIDATEIGGSVGAILPAGIAMVAAAGPAALAATGEGYLYLGVRGATFLAANEEVLGHLTGAGTLAFLYGASRDQDTAAAALSSQSPMADIGVALSGVRLLAQDAGTVSAAAWRWAKPGMGNALEASLYKIGRLAYAVPPAAKGTAPIVEDTVSLFHQGTLRGGQVSSTRGLSTSLSSDLSHYRPGGQLYEFQVPRSTYNQWLDEGFVMPKTDLHLPTGIVTPEIRVLPPASGSLNQYLVRPPGG